MKKYLIIIIAAISIFSCKKEMITYTGESGVYFYLGNKGRDYTLKFGTVPGEIKDSVISIEVDLMGHVVPYDREIKYSILENDTMPARLGVNYELFSEKSYIPADSNRGYIKIKIIRTPDLNDVGNVFNLTLVPTDELKLLYPIRYERTTVSLNIFVDEYTPKPYWWGTKNDSRVGYKAFGDFSAKKSNFVCDLVASEYDQTINRIEWATEEFLLKRGEGRIKAYGIYAQQHLDNLKEQGIIILDEPKVVGKDTLPAEPMVMGPNSQIH